MRHEDFSDLVLAHMDDVGAYARRLADRGWDADDLVQAAYERAFSRWRDLRNPGRARAWLFSITHRLFLDGVRSRRARPELRLVSPRDSLAPEPVVSADSVERLAHDALERALVTLSEPQREVVLLCDLWGFSYDEIAEIVGTPVGTVRSRIARGRRGLLEALVALRVPREREGRRS